MRSLTVEGWRGIAHSYAVVNQFQLLALGRMQALALYHRDLPFYGGHWRTMNGLFSSEAESTLRRLPPPPEGPVDAVYRIGFPYDLDPAQGALRTVVFGTSELLSVTGMMLARPGDLARQMRESDTDIITCSNWSRQGFIRSGAPAHRVSVVPHGVAPDIYRPLNPEERAALRRRLGWDPYFIFLSVGTMKGNKGLRLMLLALAALAERHPDVRLVLKGSDGMYDSRRLVNEMADTLTEAEKQTVLDRIFYLGDPLSFSAMARLYQAADAYVTPYLAEGFNLPALEAAACGLPVICTRGGPTDDFAHPECFLGIDSRPQQKNMPDGSTNVFLVPDQDHLMARMRQVVEDDALRTRARAEMSPWIHHRYSWDQVTRQLLATIYDLDHP